MHLNTYKAGFKKEWALVLNLVASFVCSFYCFWLLSVVFRKMWNQSVPRLQSISVNREVQSISQKDTTNVSVEVSRVSSSEDVNKAANVDKKIKWVVTLYIFFCGLTCFGMGCEHLIFAIANPPGRICAYALYVSCLRLFTDGFFFSFYLIRTTIALQGTVFEISKKRQYFFAIAPIASSGSLVLCYLITLYANDCEPSSLSFLSTIIPLVLCLLFWHVTLFLFLAYYLHKVTTNEFMSHATFSKELKAYLKKLFLLFIVAQLGTFSVYVCGFTPALYDVAWTAVVVDLCISCSTMLLSFSFAKPVFNRFCLCQKGL